MNNRHIIFVPGKNPKPPENDHKAQLWRTLIEGIHRANPAIADEIKQSTDHFHLIAWNYEYYLTCRNIENDIPWIDQLMKTEAASPEDKKQASSLHRRLTRLIYSIVDHLPFLLRWASGPIKNTIEETNRYFENNNNIAYKIRGQLKNILRPLQDDNASVLIIGHSLGSIITYDALWELSQLEIQPHKVDFLSLGSPLGLKFVQKKLLGHNYPVDTRFPKNIRHWMNLAAVGDITALDPCFSNDYDKMLELGLLDSFDDHCGDVYNFFHNQQGLNCHRSYGYLVNPAVGELIARWWQDNADRKDV